ncbi:MAG: bifunctional methylenetetrahydrofolate dehydrogenase/methenyltetrahydrofolate cyclohydrolase FolD [Clostridia bacterium]|nr:bifunctional methylenetetrahydrofolate dehydrogenase/methenyltetrahydrofolate cyclohydrolase FolD [Clostridia bacterium]
MILLDGKRVAAEIRGELREKVALMKKKPALAVVLVGNDPASEVYVKGKIKACEEVGIISYSYRLPENSTQKEVEKLVASLVKKKAIHGILVQLPLPKGLDADKILKLIPPEKDVDGFSSANFGKIALGEDGVSACTPLGVMELMKRYGIEVKGKRAVVVGRSKIVGRPLAMLLLNRDATVTICHSKTENLKEECLRADILIAAIGKERFITADMVKEGAVVVDVGINRSENGKLYGDVDFENVKEKAAYITPVPGGVGPMTIAMLMKNTVDAAEKNE